jgi:hypothetical protein
MAQQFRPMPTEELKEMLRYEIEFGQEKLKKLSSEWIVGENIFQAISGGGQSGGLDSQSTIAQYFSRSASNSGKSLFNTVTVARAQLFLHSKLCITEPTVVMVPQNRDYTTKERANDAQTILDSLRVETDLQEKLEEKTWVDIVTKGTACMYVGWDFSKGKVKNVDNELGEIEMTGDFCLRPVNMTDFYPQSGVDSFLDSISCIERVWVDARMAVFDYPDLAEYIDELTPDKDRSKNASYSGRNQSANRVPLYHYWEKATPFNGMLGRHVVFTIKDVGGRDSIDINPDHLEILFVGENPLAHKGLPYAWMTDIPVRNDIYGMSRAVHCAHHVDTINAFLTSVIESAENHGMPRLVAPENSTDKSVNSQDIAKIIYYNPASGGQIYHLKPTPVTTDIWRVIDIAVEEVDMIFGQNEFSKGQINRELSSYAVQIAVEMDDKFRINLFNKKKKFLQKVYELLLKTSLQFVTEERKIKFSGKRGAYKALYWAGADLEDIDVTAEYGKYMPIDPAAKKQMLLEIINSGAYEKAGGNPAKLFKIIMLDLTDVFESAKEIQASEISSMLSNGMGAKVQPWHDHPAHMDKLQDFFNSADYELLDGENKSVLWNHYLDHENKFAEIQAKAQAMPAQEGAPAEGAPPPDMGAAMGADPVAQEPQQMQPGVQPQGEAAPQNVPM